MPLIEQVLKQSSKRLYRARLNTAVTALLLRTNAREALLGYQGVQEGRYSMDAKFITGLFDLIDAEALLELVRSVAFVCLSPSDFRRLYSRVWGFHDKRVAWRHGLAWSLQAFLRLHPAEGHWYGAFIATLMRDKVEEVALAGLSMAGYLGKQMAVDDAKVLRDHLEKRSLKTMSALNSMTELYNGWTRVPGSVQKLLSSTSVKEKIIKYASDSNPDFRSCGRYCVRAMRRASKVGR